MDQQSEQGKVSETLARTDFIRHLAAEEIDEPDTLRHPPPRLPRPPTSEILITQRRGEL